MLLLIATCVFFLACNQHASDSELVRLEFGDSIEFKLPDGALAVPLDIDSESIRTVFDVNAEKNASYAKLFARVKERGQPYFLCAGAIASVKVNGADVDFVRQRDPDGENVLVVIKQAFDLETPLEIEVEYSIRSSEFSFQSGGIGFLASTSDLMDGNYFEAYGPTNFEFDQFALTWELSVVGSSTPHQLFTNGQFTYSDVDGAQTWKIVFPDYFTSSSPYMHLTNRKDLIVRRFDVALKERTLPVLVYGSSSTAVSKAVSALPGWFAELERDYGPYSHDGFVAYMTADGGGMEYVGAAVTSFWALDHELTHSWFARGVMPSNGRSGWLDEAVASWRDYGYKRSTDWNMRAPTNLANFSPFERFTPHNCYTDGRALLSELDLVFSSSGGFKKVLRDFYGMFKHHVITTQDFIDFVEARTTTNLRPLFTKNLFGDFMVSLRMNSLLTSHVDYSLDSKHPLPLTHDEVVRLR